jgi:Tol biopolymer transport system component
MLFDVGEQDGVAFLVMEFLEGETLADRLKKGALPFDEALSVATQMADGLDAGHRAGVVHRDFKPGNIMLTSRGAKIMDYGLAKLRTSAAQPDADLSALPTADKPITEKGTILGTLQYMAPEQLEGQKTDARTDIFAFGAVLYEMLTGRRAFEGKSQASLISAIMKDDPPVLSSLKPLLPSALDHVVKTCLAKEPDRRWQSAGDVGRQLKWIAESGLDAGVAAPARSMRRNLAWGLALVLAAVVAGIAGWNLKPAEPRPVTRFQLQLPPGERFTFAASDALALSPDGTHLVYVADDLLHLRAMNQKEVAPIRGTAGISRSPFFSPDGQWVGFYSSGQLMKVSVGGGAPVTLCEAVGPRGASWGTDDTIVFSQGGRGILKVSSAGGTPEVLVPASSIEGYAHGPQVLPDGKSLLFTMGHRANWDDARIVVQSLTTGERRILVEGGTGARYVSTGHLVYAFQGSLLAVPFDAARLEVTGRPVSLVEGVASTPQSFSGAANFSFSDTGSLVYVEAFESARTLVWVDREGKEESLAAEPRAYTNPRISRDGTRVALDVRDQENDIWIWDVARESLNRLTFDGDFDLRPVWTPDGTQIVFSSYRGGVANLFIKAADGTGTAGRITEAPNHQFPVSISPDGKDVVFRENTAEGRRDLWLLSLEDGGPAKALLATEFNERNGEVSPDGRWLAYQSDESGEDEIYVRPFPNVNDGRYPISKGGGTRPLWGSDGSELFYLTPDGQLMVVSVQTNPNFTVGVAEVLFEEPYLGGTAASAGRTYDISPDGQRFLMIKEAEADASASMSMTVVLNWFEELKARVPTGKR